MYVLALQTEHVRAATNDSGLIFSPLEHVICVTHSSSRWPTAEMYVPPSQGLQVWTLSFWEGAAEMRSPAPHVGCWVQVRFRWLVSSM
jgi:hypothetical protein